ncbi:MAG: DUF3445 domain-containing protein, partial [Rhodobacteraceae bacterium]|nr:DUF3445 domain-containing protein [Paracoccaceae bacterium]
MPRLFFASFFLMRLLARRGMFGPMTQAILQSEIPAAQLEAAARKLPAMRPVGEASWLATDDAFEAQRVEKARLLVRSRSAVLAQLPEAEAASHELLELVIAERGTVPERLVEDPAPLAQLINYAQEDFCILQRDADEHVLVAALLCFPASWKLAQKIGHPLTRIHVPVPGYEEQIAQRVQRLFDGVQVGRPIWRANLLQYDDPALFQPRS